MILLNVQASTLVRVCAACTLVFRPRTCENLSLKGSRLNQQVLITQKLHHISNTDYEGPTLWAGKLVAAAVTRKCFMGCAMMYMSIDNKNAQMNAGDLV